MNIKSKLAKGNELAHNTVALIFPTTIGRTGELFKQEDAQDWELKPKHDALLFAFILNIPQLIIVYTRAGCRVTFKQHSILVISDIRKDKGSGDDKYNDDDEEDDKGSHTLHICNFYTNEFGGLELFHTKKCKDSG